MTTNYSNVVQVLEEIVNVSLGDPSNNFKLLVDYGDGTGDPVTVISPTESERTAGITITVTNSSVQPDADWQYYDDSTSSWVNLDDQDPFLRLTIPSSPSNPQLWGYQLVASEDIDLEVWGNRRFRLMFMSDFVDGQKQVLTNYGNAIDVRFEMDYGTTPDPVRTLQPLDTYLDENSEASFSTEYKVYESSGTNIVDNWQYSDDYDASSPESATWVDIDVSTSGLSYTSASTSGDLLSIAYGVVGTAPSFASRIAQLNVTSHVSNRVYRHKFTVS